MTDTTKTTNKSRRTFLKGSSAAVAASTLVGAIGSRAYAQGDGTLKIGLIGAGGRGRGAATQALSASGPMKLVAIADAFQFQIDDAMDAMKAELDANNLGDRLDVPKERQFTGFDAYKQVVEAGVDGLVIATSPGFRPDHFAYAVEQGKHVFMEKPVATDPEGVRKVLAANELAKQKGLKVGVGLQRHHSRSYQDTMQQIKEGVIGDPLFFRAYWNGRGVWIRGRQEFAEKLGRQPTEMEYQMRNWYYFNWLCGDHIVEQHIHNLDVCNWIMRETKGVMHPFKAQGMGGREVRKGPDTGQIFDHHFVEFEYPDGEILISQCRHQPDTFGGVTELVTGSKGEANMEGAKIKTFDGERWRFRGDNPNPYQVEHDVMWLAVRDNNEHNEADYGAHSTMTAILGRLATYSGQLLSYDRCLNEGFSEFPYAQPLTWNSTPPVVPDANGNYPTAVPGKFDPYMPKPKA